MEKNKKKVVIKKYANRRLYNTGTSTYAKLEDLAEMVKNGEEFVVLDAKTEEDLTRSVLTQIIFELETKEQNLFAGRIFATINWVLWRQYAKFGSKISRIITKFLQ